MKIALLLSGEIRDSFKQYKSLKDNLLDLYDVDIFLSTWSSNGMDRMLQIFKPVSVDIEDYSKGYNRLWKSITEPYEHKLEQNANLLSCLSMWYKTYRVNVLRLQYEQTMGVKYDLIIKSRPDLTLEEPFKLEVPKENTLYIPRGWDWSGGINDLCAYGDSHSINKYCGLYHFYEPSVKAIQRKLNPEIILDFYLKTIEGLKIERPEIDMTLRGLNIKSTYHFSKK